MTDKEKNKKLESILKNTERKYRSLKVPENQKIFNYLNDKLTEMNIDGEVESILTYDMNNKRINCYGKRLNPGMIFNQLNMSIGIKGTKLTGVVACPSVCRLSSSSYEKGYFVNSTLFNQNENNNKYVALVNIDVDENNDAFFFYK